MPPKSQRAVGGRGRSGEDTKEDPLQAVIVADTFETKFVPFTLERPRCLLPLANTPLIEYTLEYLASAGVEEVYIYAGAHVDQVETYIDASRWKSNSSPFRKFVFLRCVASSVGDVMRDLDQKGLMSGDFITVSGDIVCDFPIHHALQQHKSRREKDKNAIMTMLLRESKATHHQQTNSTIPTFVIDPTKDRCLHYEEGKPEANYNAHIDPEMLKSPELDIRQDLIDCRIDICTPDVLSLWSDNFDNQAPRKDFLFGVLKDYELNGKTIHTYMVKEHYAARAGDLSSYASISEDMQRRLVTSMTVENNVFSGTHYQRSRRGPVRDSEIILARPNKIDSRTVIGAGTSIGAGSTIQKSVIGQRCHVGRNSYIESAFVWDDATVGSNVKILRAIIGGEAFVGDNSIIGEGALISFGVRIAPGTKVPAGARITRVQQVDNDVKQSERLVGGSEGKGFAYNDDDDEDESFSTSSGLVYQRPDLNESVSTLASDMSEPPSSINGSRSQSFATNMSDEDTGDRFQHDTVGILAQRMQEGKHVDDMLSELMGLRFSGGADETQVRRAVAIALMKHIHVEIEAGKSAADASRRSLEAYHTLIRRAQAQQTTDEQVSILLEMQRDLIHRSDGAKTLLFVTKDLYDLDVLAPESFTAWWADERSFKDSDMAKVREPTAQFIEWLEEAESESESEEDE